MSDATSTVTETETPEDEAVIETNPIDSTSAEASVPTLFKHSLREKWGLGMILAKEDDRVHLQFQDGRKRTFKEGYYHLFDPVDRRLDVTMGIVDALQAMAPDSKPKRRSTAARPVTLDEQIAYFDEVLWTEGFRGDAYTEKHRGDGRKRPLKRHRDALIELAQTELAKRPLLKALTEGNPSAVHEAAGKVVACTDLVKVAERKKFLAMDEEFHAPFANALYAMLYGKAELQKSMGDVVAWLERGMDQTPSWELVTLFLGALRPEEHSVIRYNVHSRQAAFMAPGLTLPKRPMGTLYKRLLKMTASVKEALEEADLEPRDYIDVFDFMWATLRPAAQKKIRARTAKPRAEKKDAEQEAA